jgi:hypothetical protein
LGSGKLIREDNYWWDLFYSFSPFLSSALWYLIRRFIKDKPKIKKAENKYALLVFFREEKKAREIYYLRVFNSYKKLTY